MFIAGPSNSQEEKLTEILFRPHIFILSVNTYLSVYTAVDVVKLRWTPGVLAMKMLGVQKER